MAVNWVYYTPCACPMFCNDARLVRDMGNLFVGILPGLNKKSAKREKKMRSGIFPRNSKKNVRLTKFLIIPGPAVLVCSYVYLVPGTPVLLYTGYPGQCYTAAVVPMIGSGVRGQALTQVHCLLSVNSTTSCTSCLLLLCIVPFHSIPGTY